VDEARKIIESQQISLIILDVITPRNGRNHFSQRTQAEPQSKNIPVIIASNLGKEEEIEKRTAEGASGYVVKANTTPGKSSRKLKKILEI